MDKDNDYRRMIHTARWLRLRRAKLTQNPLCQRCQAEGRVRAATEVHHIKPVEDGLSLREKESLMFDPHNLMALCHACHVAVHTEMGRSGKAQAKRKAEEQRREFKRRFMGEGDAHGL